MDPNEAGPKTARIVELAALLQQYKDAYYNGRPIVSDAAYDALEDELRDLDPEHAILKSVGAAPQEEVTQWEKARHVRPMGSLNKVVNEEEFRDWIRLCDKEGAASKLESISKSLLVTEKLDGLSLAVQYEKGVLESAITRGDGEYGENITSNARRMKGVPAKLRKPITVSIRGEIILKLSDLKRGFPGYERTARNKAAGTSKRYDGQGCEYLTVFFYDVEGDVEYETEKEKFESLVNLGLIVPPFSVADAEGVLKIYNEYSAKKRPTLDYEIDGLVVRANDIRTQHLIGELHNRPRAAVAFKFASMAKISTVLEIRWDTGPSGRVTPIATIAPVEIGGAMVKSVVLHNASTVERLGIGIGDEVLVSRRNDVIPHLEEVVVKHGETAPIPTTCASCGSPLVIKGEYHQCVNLDCIALIHGRIHRWVGVQDIMEWGDKLIAQLVEAELVREPADLYKLTIKDIAKLERRGEVIGKKVIDNLHKRLPLTLPVFMASLGIEEFGLQTAELIVNAGYDTLEKIQSVSAEDLAKIKGLGEIRAKTIAEGIAGRKEEIERLLAAGVVPTAPKAGGGLAGVSFCFTGALSKPRKEYEEMVLARGGQVLSSVTKELNYLVMAEDRKSVV